MTPQVQYLAFTGRGWIDRLRWRACWALMPALGLAQEKRRLQKIAQECGASRAAAIATSSLYFKTLQDNPK
jgi:hypothetical protein